MKKININHIVIIGGGLAGLTSAILLSREGYAVTVFEKNQYPFHRVCGEYVSNEVLPFLQGLGLDMKSLCPAHINRFELSSVKGKAHRTQLPLGGFGISRYKLDYELYQMARKSGVSFIHDQVTVVDFEKDKFVMQSKKSGEHEADIVIGSFGKRSNLDSKMERPFMSKPSPYVGVKYHIKYDCPKDLVALHNFPGGYCGINAIEDDKVNLCYLTKRENIRKYGDVRTMESEVLHKNPHLAEITHNAEFLFDKPLVISEVSFETKSPIEDHIFMCGDAAGMIAPLCGNGMAMAIRSAKTLSDVLVSAQEDNLSREEIEAKYLKNWNREFKNRLKIGRTIQKLFGNGYLSGLSVNLIKSKPIADFIITQTHGQPFS